MKKLLVSALALFLSIGVFAQEKRFTRQHIGKNIRWKNSSNIYVQQRWKTLYTIVLGHMVQTMFKRTQHYKRSVRRMARRNRS